MRHRVKKSRLFAYLAEGSPNCARVVDIDSLAGNHMGYVHSPQNHAAAVSIASQDKSDRS